MANTATLTIATNILTAPGEAFAAIKEKPAPWLPLLLVLLGSCLATYLYMNAVDYPWLLDQGLANSDLTEEERRQMVDTLTQLSPGVRAVGSAAIACIFYLAAYALCALYFTGVSFATNNGVKFGQWFGLLWWCSLPVVLSRLATVVNVLTGDMRFEIQPNPLAFGNLLGIDATNASGTVEAVLLQIDPTSLWALVLSIFGYQAFSQKSIVHAAAVVLAPIVVIVLISVVL